MPGCVKLVGATLATRWAACIFTLARDFFESTEPLIGMRDLHDQKCNTPNVWALAFCNLAYKHAGVNDEESWSSFLLDMKDANRVNMRHIHLAEITILYATKFRSPELSGAAC